MIYTEVKIVWKRFRDHCHFTGEYRGAAHSTFTLKYSVPEKNPIPFHNESNYDYHSFYHKRASRRI